MKSVQKKIVGLLKVHAMIVAEYCWEQYLLRLRTAFP